MARRLHGEKTTGPPGERLSVLDRERSSSDDLPDYIPSVTRWMQRLSDPNAVRWALTFGDHRVFLGLSHRDGLEHVEVRQLDHGSGYGKPSSHEPCLLTAARVGFRSRPPITSSGASFPTTCSKCISVRSAPSCRTTSSWPPSNRSPTRFFSSPPTAHARSRSRRSGSDRALAHRAAVLHRRGYDRDAMNQNTGTTMTTTNTTTMPTEAQRGSGALELDTPLCKCPTASTCLSIVRPPSSCIPDSGTTQRETRRNHPPSIHSARDGSTSAADLARRATLVAP